MHILRCWRFGGRGHVLWALLLSGVSVCSGSPTPGDPCAHNLLQGSCRGKRPRRIYYLMTSLVSMTVQQSQLAACLSVQVVPGLGQATYSTQDLETQAREVLSAHPGARAL